jgi:dTMP kinase
MGYGSLIAIEGIDGVGKNTQAKLLCDYIRRQKGNCGFFSFPRYDTPTGKEIAKYLRGETPNLSLIEKANLFSNDRLAARTEILEYLESGIDVVCDRYILSNCAYFSCQDPTNKIIEHILHREIAQNDMPIVRLLVILSLPLEISMKLILKKDTREYTTEALDEHEKNLELQSCVNNYYNSKDFEECIVYCNKGDEILSVDEIHNKVVEMYKQSQIPFPYTPVYVIPKPTE